MPQIPKIALAGLLLTAPLALSSPALAQAFLDNRCPDQYVYLLGDTPNYTITLCGSRQTGQPTHYLGVSKRDNTSILLPLSSRTEGRFTARNGQYLYTLNVRARTLTVSRAGQRLLVEPFTPETP